ncbi:RNA polymerase sigma factor [Paenisporosarcina quisquiliarum]|uniref:RNA polymerase sigma factor n=1 Tax=Paenisporosarcina quisquiliarum TaxID=365346 RepID=UPI003736FD6E
MTTDERLIFRLCNKDRQSLEEIYNRYEKLLWNIVTKTTTEPDICEQVITQVFQELWNNPQDFNNGRKLSSLLIECCKSQLSLFSMSKTS